MAGIEQLEVHSRSYIVRWVQVIEGNTLSWSVQPHKKSINFGVVKHPGNGATNILSASGPEDLSPESSHTHGVSDAKTGRSSKREHTAQDLLTSKGFIPIKWCGRFEADKVSMGTYDVTLGERGMYGLVFDNTFSKQTSKTATFVIITYPSDAPPTAVNHLPNLQLPQGNSQSSLAKYGGLQGEGIATGSSDSLHSHTGGGRPASASGRSDGGGSANYHVGTLSKRRRRKGQGYARRFFSLDYISCTLSYYYNRNSSALRGAIPLSLAAVTADERRREISIDSGAEIWHLKAANDKDFQDWARALEKASRVARGLETVQKPARTHLKVETRAGKSPALSNYEEDAEWHQVESLVSRVVGTRDALRRLTKDVGSRAQRNTSVTSGRFLTPGSSGGDDKGEGYFPPTEKKSFWRRKSSAPPPPSSLIQQASSALGIPASGSAIASSSDAGHASKRKSRGAAQEELSFQDHCQSLLTDLDSVVAEFTTLVNNSKRRRLPIPSSSGAVSRRSMDTTSSVDEFFDAEDAQSRVVKIGPAEDDSESDDDGVSFQDNSSLSSDEDEDPTGAEDTGDLFPSKPKSLAPLPVQEAVPRRTTIPEAKVLPPSLIAFVRKNVGKDLSTISMPVSANEPISLLQKVVEQLEYVKLLNLAAKQQKPIERLLYVTAFAVSQFSGSRVKERAIRKPFTPLLGETYELVRGEKEVPGGFRVLVEKVQHRPLKLAMQADSANWSFSQSPSPAQKFWGKSAEITTEGRVRIALRLPDGTGELYSWNIATMFLRNVVMGEKYVEPVGSMQVINDSTGHKASVEFRSKGMFGGRAEEVHADTFNPDGSNTGSSLAGNWTSGLKTVGPGKAASDEIWQVGALVDNAPQTYGMTTFAAALNEITSIEKDRMAPTDCRLRPDQRMAEQGNLDEAEEAKVKLEEAQRNRRRALEESGEAHKPRWFVMSENSPEGEEVWKIKGGKDGYWESRERASWAGVEDLFNV